MASFADVVLDICIQGVSQICCFTVFDIEMIVGGPQIHWSSTYWYDYVPVNTSILIVWYQPPHWRAVHGTSHVTVKNGQMLVRKTKKWTNTVITTARRDVVLNSHSRLSRKCSALHRCSSLDASTVRCAHAYTCGGGGGDIMLVCQEGRGFFNKRQRSVELIAKSGCSLFWLCFW